VDGLYLAAAAPFDAGCRLWDLRTGREALSLDVGRRVAFTPDGKKLLVWDEKELRIIDLKTLGIASKISWRVDQPESLPAVVSPDGRILAIGSDHGVVRRWNLMTAQELFPEDGHDALITDLVFDRSGTVLKTSSWDRTVRTWKVPTGKLLKTSRFPNALRISPNGRWGALGQFFEQKAWIWDLATEQQLPKEFERMTDVRFASDSRLVLKNPENGFVFYDIQKDQESRKVNLEEPGADILHFSDDLRWAAGRRELDDVILLWDVQSGRITRHFPCKFGTVRLSRDNRMLACTGKELQVFETQTERLIHRFPSLHPTGSFLHSIAFSPDGRMLACGNRFGFVSFWDVLTGTQLGAFQGHLRNVACLQFSPDGRLLVSGSEDTTAVLWKVPAIAPLPQRLGPKELDILWDDLASEKPGKAYQAIAAFLPVPEAALSYLKARLRPISAPDPEKLKALFRDLDNLDFAERDKAMRKLVELGDLAAAELRLLSKEGLSLEIRRRASKLLDQANGPLVSGEKIRSLRAIHLLENLGKSAEPLLETMASGAPESRVTQEAKHALRRLQTLAPR
jgi:WD40 repeat protein